MIIIGRSYRDAVFFPLSKKPSKDDWPKKAYLLTKDDCHIFFFSSRRIYIKILKGSEKILTRIETKKKLLSSCFFKKICINF